MLLDGVNSLCKEVKIDVTKTLPSINDFETDFKRLASTCLINNVIKDAIYELEARLKELKDD